MNTWRWRLDTLLIALGMSAATLIGTLLVRMARADDPFRRAYAQQIAAKAFPAQPQTMTYREAKAESFRTGIPLVLGLDCDAPIGEWVSHRMRTVDYPLVEQPQTILICVPASDGWLYIRARLPAGATALDVRRALAPQTQSQVSFRTFAVC